MSTVGTPLRSPSARMCARGRAAGSSPGSRRCRPTRSARKPIRARRSKGWIFPPALVDSAPAAPASTRKLRTCRACRARERLFVAGQAL